MRKIIFDTDPGHDDIMAILTALAHESELELLSFCTVAGNNTVDNVTRNILKIEEYLDLDIPVYKGCDRPLYREAHPQDAHGASGLDGPVLPEPSGKEEDIDALSYYRDILKQNEKVTIVAIGPLTNLGKVLQEEPELAEHIEMIAIMGGGLNGGNITPYAEFNIWHDPEAARIVFASGVKIVMAPLEVCYAGGIKLAEVERFRSDKKVAKLVYELFGFYDRYAIERGWDSTAVFDLIPVLWLLDPELFVAKQGKVEVITEGEREGQTIFTEGEGNHLVLLEARREGCMDLFFKAIDTLDKRYEKKD